MDRLWVVVLCSHESLSGRTAPYYPAQVSKTTVQQPPEEIIVRFTIADEIWERIHTAFNEAELHLITGILAGEGLEYRVKSRRVPQLPFSHSALGAAEIYVPKHAAPLAQRILMIYRNC